MVRAICATRHEVVKTVNLFCGRCRGLRPEHVVKDIGFVSCLFAQPLSVDETGVRELLRGFARSGERASLVGRARFVKTERRP